MMTPEELRGHLARLDLTQTGLAQVARTTPRTVRRWAAKGVSKHATAAFIRDLKLNDPEVYRARSRWSPEDFV